MKVARIAYAPQAGHDDVAREPGPLHVRAHGEGGEPKGEDGGKHDVKVTAECTRF